MMKTMMSNKKILLLTFISLWILYCLLSHGIISSRTVTFVVQGCANARLCPPSSETKPKHTNVVFLKTHKTGSSTVQNVLFRFAERHNLVVALPLEEFGTKFCYPEFFSPRFVHPHTLPANIVTNHMRFDKTEVQRLMPDDTIFVTIMREPGAMFESVFGYFKSNCESFRRVPNGSLEAFLEKPRHYYRPDESDSRYACNLMTFDLGGDKDRPATDEAYAEAFVEEVERVFSLVMITEYFDESLILLRHLLSWDLEDVVYMNHNMRTSSSKQSLTPELTAKIRAWNSIDARLYDHFNASLWRRLAALGTDVVEREVALLRQAQESLTRRCFLGQMPLSSGTEELLNFKKINANVSVVQYSLPKNLPNRTEELCLKVVMPEPQYTSVLLQSESLRHQELKAQGN